MGLTLVVGPANAGPGERQQMLEAAAAALVDGGVQPGSTIRIDVPGRGAGADGDGSLRTELEPLIPLLQSGSLFGDTQGVEVIDGQNLRADEAELVAGLLETADLKATEVAVLVFGSAPKRLSEVARARGSVVSIKKIWERQAATWLNAQVKARGLEMDKGAEEAMVQRFGTDTAAMTRAMDQLEGSEKKITKALILDRFKNRPDEPAFNILDAISRGDIGEALRRLSDFLVHGHPLVYLAALESDLKKRTLAAAAPDEETFRILIGARPNDRRANRFWSRRGRVRESLLRQAQEALVRADRTIKSQPEDVHLVTLERLTVALCLWYR